MTTKQSFHTLMFGLAIAALTIVSIAPSASAALNTNLYYGMTHSSDVKQLQEFLISDGIMPTPATGNFYSLTLKAVKSYQAENKINATGYVGSITRAAINAELAANLSDSDTESTNETGAVPATPEPAKTNTDLYNSILTQIQVLKDQLAALQAQQATLDQLAKIQVDTQQTINQIQQNTTPPPAQTIVTPVGPVTQVRLPIEPSPISGTIYIRSDIGNNLNQEDYLDFSMDGQFLQHMKFIADDSRLTIDTTLLSNGTHILSVKAFDKKGIETDDSETLNVLN